MLRSCPRLVLTHAHAQVILDRMEELEKLESQESGSLLDRLA